MYLREVWNQCLFFVYASTLAPHQGNVGAVDHTLIILARRDLERKEIPLNSSGTDADQHPSVRIQFEKYKKQNKTDARNLLVPLTENKQKNTLKLHYIPLGEVSLKVQMVWTLYCKPTVM